MRTPVWNEHPDFFRGAPALLEALARASADLVKAETGRDARARSKSAVPSTPTSRQCALLARISRGTSTLDLDQARAEIVCIAATHGVPVPLPDFTESQQARQLLAAIAPSHREFQGDRASVDTSNPATDRHFKTGHHAGELRPAGREK